jgi:hypothetical protein
MASLSGGPDLSRGKGSGRPMSGPLGEDRGCGAGVQVPKGVVGVTPVTVSARVPSFSQSLKHSLNEPSRSQA